MTGRYEIVENTWTIERLENERPVYVAVLRYVTVSYHQWGIPPTINEIREAVGISSASVVAHHLDWLARAKLLRCIPRSGVRYYVPAGLTPGQMLAEIAALKLALKMSSYDLDILREF